MYTSLSTRNRKIINLSTKYRRIRKSTQISSFNKTRKLGSVTMLLACILERFWSNYWNESNKNNPITLKDFKLAENIFGPGIGSLKDKTSRKKPLHAVSECNDIPLELLEAQHKTSLYMETIRINCISFLPKISRKIMYQTTEWVPNQFSKAQCAKQFFSSI